MTLNDKKNQSFVTNSNDTYVELVDKDIKTIIILYSIYLRRQRKY